MCCVFPFSFCVALSCFCFFFVLSSDCLLVLFCFLPNRKRDVRKFEVDNVDIYKSFRPSDIVRAEVVSSCFSLLTRPSVSLLPHRLSLCVVRLVDIHG
jgi:hypothetical protein